MSGRSILSSSSRAVTCSEKEQYCTIPAYSTQRFSCSSPQLPRVFGARNAVINCAVSFFKRGKRSGNRLLHILDQRLHFGIRARAGISISRVCSSRLLSAAPSGSSMFLIASSLASRVCFCLAGLSAKFLLRKRQKGLRVGAQSVGGSSLEGRVEVGLHLRIFFFLTLFHRASRRQLRRFAALSQPGLIELALSTCTALAGIPPEPKKKTATATSAKTTAELPTAKILFA